MSLCKLFGLKFWAKALFGLPFRFYLYGVMKDVASFRKSHSAFPFNRVVAEEGNTTTPARALFRHCQPVTIIGTGLWNPCRFDSVHLFSGLHWRW